MANRGRPKMVDKPTVCSLYRPSPTLNQGVRRKEDAKMYQYWLDKSKENQMRNIKREAIVMNPAGMKVKRDSNGNPIKTQRFDSRTGLPKGYFYEYTFDPHNAIVEGTRILRPKEFELLLGAMDKISNRIKFRTLLFTGARYAEIPQLWHDRHADRDWVRSLATSPSITIKNMKPRCRNPEREVKINRYGQEALEMFFQLPAVNPKNRKAGNGRQPISPLPTYLSWQSDLRRWAFDAGISIEGLNTKCTRKTWETWCFCSYPRVHEHILLSQGHGAKVSMQHYIDKIHKFTTEEILEIKEYTRGLYVE